VADDRSTQSDPAKAQWVCPACGRRFARARQSHSCNPRTVESHFEGKDPSLRGIFDTLVRKLSKTGPLRVDAVQTSIHLISRHHFGGVTVRRDSLRLGFLASKPISSARIAHRLVLGPNRVEHVVVLKDEADVDDELIRWLSDAQRLQS
jgi:uncharacterized protein DUF5655